MSCIPSPPAPPDDRKSSYIIHEAGAECNTAASASSRAPDSVRQTHYLSLRQLPSKEASQPALSLLYWKVSASPTSDFTVHQFSSLNLIRASRHFTSVGIKPPQNTVRERRFKRRYELEVELELARWLSWRELGLDVHVSSRFPSQVFMIRSFICRLQFHFLPTYLKYQAAKIKPT
ncbi:hypothetical protein DL95DRAFT_403357 [Leptodontidium sp. 2 PMI_412]|nr:hypothetical protein DL95DRAFT_403357 [Leptodontidium sp. 2 PMI_412]